MKMGKTSASDRLNQLRLDIKPPSLFRCPISLEVMRSPVSLVTGVTYDRSSIQRWLDSGNTTCPATMLPLPSTDLIPNLTLRRLIGLWSSSVDDKSNDNDDQQHPSVHLQKLAAFFDGPDVDDTVKNGVINAGDFVDVLVSAFVSRDGGGELNAAVEVVSVILCSEWSEEETKERLASALCCDLDAAVASLIAGLRDRSKLKSRTNCARILQALLLNSESEIISISKENLDALVTELVHLINSTSTAAIDEGLGCLVELLPWKRAVKSMAQSRLVPALVRILSSETLLPISSKTVERAIVMMEASVNCAEGRAAISEMVEECVEAVMGRMMKAGKRGKGAAVVLLWGVCYSSWGDQRGKEAVASVSGGMAKILVVMQGDCSPAVRKMAGDLLRVFRVNAKSLVAGYDTKTTHIMPF